jgi:hypothetical protein
MTHDRIETPPIDLLRAIEEFNRGDWFACHETLEDLWRDADGETRDFYQGLIKIAAALHHWRNGNFVGAVRLLDRGRSLLCYVCPTCLGVSLLPFVSAVETLHKALTELGPERMGELPRDLIPTLAISERVRKESKA